MLDYLTLGDTPIHLDTAASKRIARQVAGLEALAAPRQTTRPRPSAHGSIDTTRYSDGQLIVVDAECAGDDEVEAFSEWDEVKAALLATLPDGSPLKWRRGADGPELQRTVKLASLVDPPMDSIASQLVYQAQLHSSDPRAYSQTLQQIEGEALTDAGGGFTFPLTFPFTFTESSGGEAVCTNNGSRGSPPIVEIHGYATSPAVVLTETGERVQLTGEISAGEFIEIDFFERTVLLNGTTDRRNLLDNGASRFFELPREATSTVRLVATNWDAGAHVVVRFRDAY